MLTAWTVSVLGLAGCLSPESGADPGAWDERALAWVVSVQRSDGGFGERADFPSSFVTSLWVGMALIAKGFDPRQARTQDGPSLHEFLAGRVASEIGGTSDELSASNEAALGLLYVVASGDDPQTFGGVDLEEALLSHQNESGAVGTFLNENLVGAAVLATALGRESSEAEAACAWAVSELERQGWEGFAEESWYVANGLLTLMACGREGPFVEEGLDYLATFEQPDGGFSHRSGTTASDASTTASAVGAFRFAGPSAAVEAPWLTYITSLQRSDGSIPFSSELASPVLKTTSEVLIAFSDRGLYEPPVQVQYHSTTSSSLSV